MPPTSSDVPSETPSGPRPSPLVEAAQDTILIEDLVLPAHIGLLETEKGRTQAVRFNIEIRTVPGYRQIVRQTGRYVSYADTVLFIKDRAEQGGHIDLVEEWAEMVAEFVLENDLVDQVTVTVSKPEIFAEAAGVGIRICRRRR